MHNSTNAQIQHLDPVNNTLNVAHNQSNHEIEDFSLNRGEERKKMKTMDVAMIKKDVVQVKKDVKDAVHSDAYFVVSVCRFWKHSQNMESKN